MNVCDHADLRPWHEARALAAAWDLVWAPPHEAACAWLWPTRRVWGLRVRRPAHAPGLCYEWCRMIRSPGLCGWWNATPHQDPVAPVTVWVGRFAGDLLLDLARRSTWPRQGPVAPYHIRRAWLVVSATHRLAPVPWTITRNEEGREILAFETPHGPLMMAVPLLADPHGWRPPQTTEA